MSTIKRLAVVAFAAFAVLVSSVSLANESKVGDYTWSWYQSSRWDDETQQSVRYCVIEGVDPMLSGAVTIPASFVATNEVWNPATCQDETRVEDLPVEEIGWWAFSYSPELTKVVLPASLKSIGGYAFEDCAKLSEVVFPAGLESIEPGVFSGCREFVNFKLPVALKTVASSSFQETGWWTNEWAKAHDPITGAIKNEFIVKDGWLISCLSTNATLVLPDSVTGIAESPFYNGWELQQNLRSFSTGDGLKAIPGSLFGYGYTNLTSVTIGKSVGEIGYSAFQNCTALKDIAIPASVTNIGFSAFEACESLKSITFPEKMEYIPYKVCYGCKSLTSVTMGEGVTEIGGGAFAGCTALKEITLPAEVSSLDYTFISKWDPETETYDYSYLGVFTGCTALERVTFLGNLEMWAIGSYSFKDCTSLTTIDLPANVNSIYNQAFAGCSNLVSITGGNVSYVASDALDGTKLAKADFVVVGGNLVKYNGKGGDVVVPADVKNSNWYNAFNGATNIKSLTIPANLRFVAYSLKDNLWASADTLVAINVAEGSLSDYSSEDGILYNKDKTELIFCPYAKKGKVTVPETVRMISEEAFMDCVGITAVDLPCGCTYIGDSAFANTGLAAIEIPEGLRYINEGTFAFCTNLTAVTIPSEVVDIEESAFSGCTKLAKIEGGENLSYVSYSAFDETEWLTAKSNQTFVALGSYLMRYQDLRKMPDEGELPPVDVTIPAGIKHFSEAAFWDVSIKTLVIGDDVKSIPDWAFGEQVSLASVKFGASVETIGEGAFYGCTGLKSVDLPASVKSLGWDDGVGVFAGCVNLSSVTLNKGLEYIGANAFADCVGLKSIAIPDSVKEIGYGAFANCWALASVQIGAGVSYIGSSAFACCTNLTSVTLPENVMVLGEEVFCGCEKLSEIKGGLGLKEMGEGVFSETAWQAAQSNETFVMVGDYLVKYNGKNGGAVVLPANTKAVAWDAFDVENATNVTAITIPKGLVETPYAYEVVADEEDSWRDGSIPVLNFLYADYLEKLAAVKIEEGHPDYSSVDGIVYDLRKTRAVLCPPAFKGKVTLPSTVLTIGSEVFDGVVGLTGVVFPDKLQTIGAYAFSGCTNLTGAIVLPASVSSIGTAAFKGCTGLTSVKLPTDLGCLSSYVFEGCTGLTAIDIPEKVGSLYDRAFAGCTNLVKVTGGAGLTSVAWNSSLDYDAYDAFANTPWRAAQTNVDYVVLGSLLVAYQGESTDLVIPEGVKAFNSYGGFDWYGFTSVVIGKDLAELPWEFRNVGSNLTNITVDAANAGYAAMDGVLYNKNRTELIKYPAGRKDKTFVIPEGVVKIAEYAFYGSSNLEEVAIPATCVEIGTWAFAYTGLKSVTLPASVTKLGQGAFYQCGKLAEVAGGEGLRFVEFDAFGSTKWQTLHSTNDFVVVGGTLVEWHGEGTDVVIPEGVKSLAFSAFPETVTSIALPASFEQNVSAWDFNSYVRLAAFKVAESNEFYAAVDGVLYDRSMTYLICCPQAKTGELKIPQGVRYVEDAAARGAQISGVDIPDSVESIWGEAFYNCRSLATVKGGAGLKALDADGYANDPVSASSFAGTPFFEGDPCSTDPSFVTVGSCLIGFRGKLPESLVIPEGVTYIAGGVFEEIEGVGKVTSLTLPSTLQVIGSYAFSGFSALTELVIPDSVVCIGSGAFYGCRNLAVIAFGNGLREIGYEAFAYCRKLTSVSFPASLESIEEDAFAYCTALTTVKGLDGVGYADWYAFSTTPWGVAKFGSADFQLIVLGGTLFGYTGVCPEAVEIPEGVVTVGSEAFAGTRNLKSVTFPASLNSISVNAFGGCDGISAIELPELLYWVEDDAFADCSALAKVVGGENLTSVGADAFADTAFLKNTTGVAYVGVAAVGCNNIAEGAAVEIEDGTKTLATKAFSGCKLGSVTLPKSLMDLGWSAFCDCDNLKSVVIPRRVSYLSGDAFAGCTALESVQFANPEIMVALRAFQGCRSLKSVGMVDGISLKGWKVATGRLNFLKFEPEEFYIFVLPDFVPYGNVATPIAEVVPFEEESDAVKIPFDGVAASTYEGFLTVAEGDRAGEIAGTITVKAAKAGKSGKSAGISKLTVTVVPFAAKKRTIKGEYTVSTQAIADEGGLLAGLKLGQQALAGMVDGYKVNASRNNMKDKTSPDKELAANFKGKAWTLAFETLPDEDGDLDDFAKGMSTFTFTVGSNGKVSIAGMIADGTKVSGKSQMVIGEKSIGMPFVYTKKQKDAYRNFGFTLWVDKSGEVLYVSGTTQLECPTFAHDVRCVDVDVLAPLADGTARFSVSQAELPTGLADALGQFLPMNELFTVAGKKWTFEKAAKIAYKNGVFDEEAYNKGVAAGKTNNAGVKLSYTPKTGAFKGSFSVFRLDEKGKLKKFSMKVNGVVVNGVGYATAVEKKNGSMSVIVRR